jgi:hypothetical protein
MAIASLAITGSSSARIVSTPGWAANGGQANASSGTQVTTAGDVNGDGYDDVLVGAPTWNNGQYPVGRVYRYLGSSTGLSAAPAWTMDGNDFSAQFGRTVSTAGDVNADGYDDVLIGAPGYGGNMGSAWFFFGTPGGFGQTAVWSITSEPGTHNLGIAIGCAGDVDGEGHADILVSG